jgi:hypothetical protein
LDMIFLNLQIQINFKLFIQVITRKILIENIIFFYDK